MNPERPLEVPAELVDALLEHARAQLPNEACGLLAGRADVRRVTRFHPARNAAASPLRYDVDAGDLVRIVLGIEASGDDLVAIFHSHLRSPAVPSGSDLREARYPGVLHLLAGPIEGADVAPPPLRAWRIADGATHEVPLRIR